MEPEPPARKPPGPKRGPTLKKYTLTLYPDDAEWGMSLEGGLSALVRRMLRAERKRREAKEGARD